MWPFKTKKPTENTTPEYPKSEPHDTRLIETYTAALTLLVKRVSEVKHSDEYDEIFCLYDEETSPLVTLTYCLCYNNSMPDQSMYLSVKGNEIFAICKSNFVEHDRERMWDDLMNMLGTLRDEIRMNAIRDSRDIIESLMK